MKGNLNAVRCLLNVVIIPSCLEGILQSKKKFMWQAAFQKYHLPVQIQDWFNKKPFLSNFTNHSCQLFDFCMMRQARNIQ